jgi:hypothetical protein
MIYTGIGSRETPKDVIDKMVSMGRYMASHGHTLRSGGANGADTAFESGCINKQGPMEIYLPYPWFNRNESLLFNISVESRKLASKFHPNWPNLGDTGRFFMARNAYQVLGLDLKTPTDFIVCWTPGGKVTGGTGQALRMAAHYRIPVFNFGSMSVDEMDKAITSIIQKE